VWPYLAVPCRGRCWHAYGSARARLTAWAIGDREMCCSWLSVRPRPPPPAECGGSVGGFWMEQAHADEPVVVVDALDDVSVQLELGDDGGWEVNPAGMKLGKSDWLVAGLA
jgi:hypothetical protein